jgi:hypothetical protein
MKNKLQLVIMLIGCLSALAANDLAFGADSLGENLAGPELAWSIVLSPRKAGVKLYGASASSLRQQVVGILGCPDAVRSNGSYEQLEYTHRLVTGWSWDRSDFNVILKNGRVVEFGHGEIRNRSPQMVYALGRNESTAASISIPATTAATDNQRKRTTSAFPFVDQSVRQLDSSQTH